uniref:Cytochrome P450 n=1 Tax=Meloidogyne hapla TaxID=6305 RepID=A0A1I8B131_MELHA
MCAAYAVMHGGPVLRPDQMEKNIRRLPELPRRIVPVSSTDDLSLKLLNAKPVWSLLNFANWHSYWPYRYLSDPYSHEMYWHDPHSLHSPLHKRELFGKNKPNVYPYPYWARYRGYM